MSEKLQSRLCIQRLFFSLRLFRPFLPFGVLFDSCQKQLSLSCGKHQEMNVVFVCKYFSSLLSRLFLESHYLESFPLCIFSATLSLKMHHEKGAAIRRKSDLKAASNQITSWKNLILCLVCIKFISSALLF